MTDRPTYTRNGVTIQIFEFEYEPAEPTNGLIATAEALAIQMTHCGEPVELSHAAQLAIIDLLGVELSQAIKKFKRR